MSRARNAAGRPSRLARGARGLLAIALLAGAIYLTVRFFLGEPRWAIAAAAGFVGLALLGGALTVRRRWRRGRTLARLIAGTPTEFEETVARMMRGQGFRNVRRVGGAGDLTADVVASDRAGRTVVVQCKRYAPGKPVGSKEVQTFIGMQRIHHQADYGVYVTTSTYTRPARELAARHDVTLVDGADLAAVLTGGERAAWMRR